MDSMMAFWMELDLFGRVALVVTLLTLYSWFATWTGFYVVSGYRGATMKNQTQELFGPIKIPFGGRLVAYIWLGLGGPGDVLYNATIGTWRFREAPKWRRGELMYSKRVQRHVRETSPADWRRQTALEWAYILNAIAPGHIDL